jgi:hypothetical protein
VLPWRECGLEKVKGGAGPWRCAKPTPRLRSGVCAISVGSLLFWRVFRPDKARLGNVPSAGVLKTAVRKAVLVISYIGLRQQVLYSPGIPAGTFVVPYNGFSDPKPRYREQAANVKYQFPRQLPPAPPAVGRGFGALAPVRTTLPRGAERGKVARPRP